jgi:hypothetical protein
MSVETTASGRKGGLQPVRRRSTWIAWGLALQVIGLGIPVTAALQRATSDGVLETITHYTVRLIWHEMLRSRADVALIVLGVIFFLAGATVLARPFVTRRVTLFVAVPAAVTAGIAVLGVIALVCAAIIALLESPGSAGDLLNGISWPFSGKDKRRR